MSKTTWAKLDDGFWMHPKVLMAGNTAAGVFARMLSYSGCYLTDGLVPAAIVSQIVGTDRKTLPALAQYGLIEVLETGSVVIPDFLEHNKSKVEVEAARRQRREAGRSSVRTRRNGSGS